MAQPAGLSAREAEVLAELAGHATNAEIASRLFISVRTVESHVASLLRKTGAADRRELGSLVDAAEPAPAIVSQAVPMPASPFIGREAERAELIAALGEHRLVTALGPGGIGKTRLALSTLSELQSEFSDGAFYVDLVPVSEGAAIAPEVAASIGLGHQQGMSPEDIVVRWLSSRRTLLVLDNCEHLLDSVAELLERALAECPGLVVLATSRARLGVSGERVYGVPGLSVDDDDSGDAVELFRTRALAAGADAELLEPSRMAAICRTLEGSALAVELAASRVPSLGLDGVEAGLGGDRLDLLMSGRRSGGRHRSLRATLAWSVDLLTPAERAVLRRVSVFASSFTGDAATELLEGWPPHVPSVRGVLADLADQSLVVARPSSMGTRYLLLEMVRQFGAQALEEFDEETEAHARHLAWCREQAEALPSSSGADPTRWRARFDEIADEVRAAVVWAAGRTELAGDSETLAALLADLAFERGRPAEAQRMYELAARVSSRPGTAVRHLTFAAGAAELRHFGNEGLRLHREAARIAEGAGITGSAAWHLARMSELITRASGIMATPPPREEAIALIEEAESINDGDALATTRILIARAGLISETLPEHRPAAEAALAAAIAAGDRLGHSAARDQTCIAHLAAGELAEGAADAIERVELLSSSMIRADMGFEIADALLMAVECCCGTGDLTAARSYADRMLTLPSYAEEPHLATSRVLLTTALAGDFASCAEFGERFLDGWDRVGRPVVGSLSLSAQAAAAACELLGRADDAERWRDVSRELRVGHHTQSAVGKQVFSPLAMLHTGRYEETLAHLATDPESESQWFVSLWRPWYSAAWCEAAVLAGSPDAGDRLERARRYSASNPIATVLVQRAEALADDRAELPALADRLDELGAVYQAARTRTMAGDPAGNAWIRDAGLIPMVWG